MKLEAQVTNPELSKRLKELCVKQESEFFWYPVYGGENLETEKWILESKWGDDRYGSDFYSAFTVAELGEMLIDTKLCDELTRYNPTHSQYIIVEDYAHSEQDSSEANARAKMLIWLIENGKVKA